MPLLRVIYDASVAITVEASTWEEALEKAKGLLIVDEHLASRCLSEIANAQVDFALGNPVLVVDTDSDEEHRLPQYCCQ